MIYLIAIQLFRAKTNRLKNGKSNVIVTIFAKYCRFGAVLMQRYKKFPNSQRNPGRMFTYLLLLGVHPLC